MTSYKNHSQIIDTPWRFGHSNCNFQRTRHCTCIYVRWTLKIWRRMTVRVDRCSLDDSTGLDPVIKWSLVNCNRLAFRWHRRKYIAPLTARVAAWPSHSRLSCTVSWRRKRGMTSTYELAVLIRSNSACQTGDWVAAKHSRPFLFNLTTMLIRARRAAPRPFQVTVNEFQSSLRECVSASIDQYVVDADIRTPTLLYIYVFLRKVECLIRSDCHMIWILSFF